jgi:type IV pilus assembly protein PilC
VRYRIDYYLLRLPIFGRIIQMSVLVDVTRTLSILVGSGISILDSLNIVVDIANNLVYKKTFQDIYKLVEKGSPLGETFERAGIFPPILVQMVTVGEETGHLDETLHKIANYFEMESEMAIKAATALIEPLILVVLGLGVGFLVMSVITPIYNLTTSFK